MTTSHPVSKAAVLLALLPFAAACASSGTTGAAGPAPSGAAAAQAASPQMLAEGEQVFRTIGRCASCHGQTGSGSSFAPDLTDDQWLWIESGRPVRPQLVTIIRNGIPQPRQYSTPMPPMGGAQLTEQQLQAVAAFVEQM